MSSLIYPGGDQQVTPNLGLATWGMDEVLAENMILIDAAVGSGSSTLSVNGVPVTNPNLNNTTPAAPANSANVTWQVSGSSVSAYYSTIATGLLYEGNSVVLSTSGIVQTDLFGNVISTGQSSGINFVHISAGPFATSAQVGLLQSGSVSFADISDGNGNALQLGGGGASNFNLSNTSGLAGFNNPSGGNVLQLKGSSVTAPTPATSDNSTDVATTAFVKAQGYLTAAVTSITGDGTIISNAASTGAVTLTLENVGINLALMGPVSGGSGQPTYRAIALADLPTGYLWNNLGNASGALTLANGTNPTTFNQTSAVVWLWANTTTGTNLTTNASPVLEMAANYFTTVSAVDTWSLGSSLAAGANGKSTFTIGHTGSTSAIITLQGGGNLVQATNYTGGTGGIGTGTNGANGFSLWSAGAAVVDFSSRLMMAGANPIGWTSAALAFNSSFDTTISRISAGTIGIGVASGGTTGNLQLGKITLYNGVATAGNGVPSIVFQTLNTGLTANYNAGAAKTMFTPTAPGMWTIKAFMGITTVAGTSSTSPSLTLGYTDAGGIARTLVIFATSGANTTATSAQFTANIYTNGSTAVTITSAGYASNPATTMQYDMAVTAEQL